MRGPRNFVTLPVGKPEPQTPRLICGTKTRRVLRRPAVVRGAPLPRSRVVQRCVARREWRTMISTVDSCDNGLGAFSYLEGHLILPDDPIQIRTCCAPCRADSCPHIQTVQNPYQDLPWVDGLVSECGLIYRPCSSVLSSAHGRRNSPQYAGFATVCRHGGC